MDELIDLNEADVERLATLPGIGSALAERIIAYRETIRPFEEVIEVTAVPGISERMVRKFEELVTVIPPLSAEVDPFAEPEPAHVETAVVPLSEEEPHPVVPTIEEDMQEETAVENIIPELAEELSAESADIPQQEETIPDEAIEEETVVEEEAIDEAPLPLFSAIQQSEKQEQTMTEETFANEPHQAPPTDSISRRRGCIFIIIGAVAGSILGTALTLAVLAALNMGSLQFSAADQRLQTQLQQAESTIQQLNGTLEAVSADVVSVSTQTDDVAAGQADVADELEQVELSISTVEASFGDTEDEVSELQETAVALSAQIESISESAETLDSFLDGMRSLLDDLEGDEPVDEDKTATPTPTPFDGTPTPASGIATSTPNPTRTPRPTATPITLPTSTPEQQP